jgi:predicted RND superfamily exporter protein
MFEKFATFVLRNRRVLVFSLITVTIFMGYWASKAQLAYDNPKIIPDDDPDFMTYQSFKKTFGDDGSVMVIGIETNKIYKIDFFNDWYALTDRLEKTRGVERVMSIGNIPELVKSQVATENEGDSTYLDVFKQQRVIQTPPSNQLELDSLKIKIGSLRFYEGLLFKDSSNFTAIAITLEKKRLDSYERIALTEGIRKQVDSIVSKYQVKAHYSGLPWIRTEMSNKVKSEIKLFTLLSIIITGIILVLFFRSFYSLVFPILVVIVGVIWSIGTLVLFGYKITMLSSLLPPLMVVIGIANCIYLLNKYHDEYKSHNNKMLALHRVIARVGLAVFFTNITTAVGFGVFVLTGSSILQEFGVTSFFSVMFVYVISLILIPVIFSFLPSPTAKQTKHLDNKYIRAFISKVAHVVTNHRRWVYIITVCVVIASGLGMLRIKAVGFMVDDISKRDELYKDLKFLEKNIHGVMPFEIVIDTKKPGGIKDPRILGKMDALEKDIAKLTEFSKPVSIAQLIKFARQAKNDGNPKFYLIPNNLELGEIIGMMPEKSEGSKVVRGLTDSTLQKARISVQMADVGSVRIKALKKQITEAAIRHFPVSDYEVKLTGTSIIFLKGNDYLINNLLVSLLVAFIVIGGIMATIFTSLRMITISLIPNIIPLVFTAGIMGYFGVALKPSTVLVFSVTFGIAVDFAIHFLSKYRIELKRSKYNIKKSVAAALRELGPSMIYTAIILFFGFIIFGASRFGGTIALGVFTSITLVMAMFCNMIVLPSLLLSYDKALELRKLKQKAFIDYPDEEA